MPNALWEIAAAQGESASELARQESTRLCGASLSRARVAIKLDRV